MDPYSGGQKASGGAPALNGDPYNPSSVDSRIKPTYEANPAHVTNSGVFNPNKTPEPSDVLDVYNGDLVRDDLGSWWGRNSQGEYYQFYSSGTDDNGVVKAIHFAGIVPSGQVPGSVRRQF